MAKRKPYKRPKKEPEPVYFVDPSTGEYIELDLSTADYKKRGLGMAKRRLSKAARACISREISKHSKKGKPKGQAIAIGFSVCRAKGFKIPQRAGLGAYKPEKSSRSRLTAKAEARAKRSAKKAATRLMRRAAKFSPEDAPRRRIQRGYID